MDRRRDWVQAGTLILCAVLLVVTLRQGREAADLRAETIKAIRARRAGAG